MNAIFKDALREVLITLHLDLTKNLKYDRLTRKIIKNKVGERSNCIDIGCHKGEILNLILKYSPKGTHFAFEPLPHLYNNLELKYKNKAKVFPYALAEVEGETTFQFVKNAPAYSGIKKRHYDIPNPEIEEINVELRTLDSVVPTDTKIDFIKIDVEGAEFGVFKGGINLLKRNKPIILFECGKGASDYYGTQPVILYNFLNKEAGLNIYTLNGFLDNQKPMSADEFDRYFNTNKEYYFVAN